MTKIGEIRKACEVGGMYAKRGGSLIWCACEVCGEERWVQYTLYRRTNINKTGLCKKCAALKNINNGAMHNKRNGRWKGGRTKTETGYMQVRPNAEDVVVFSSMLTARGYIREHRLVMAKHIGRALLPWEIVHHKNGIRDDNRIENLELLPSTAQHAPSTLWQTEINKRDTKIIDLKYKIKLLRRHLKKALK